MSALVFLLTDPQTLSPPAKSTRNALKDLASPQAPNQMRLPVERFRLYLYTNMGRVFRQKGRILKHHGGRARGGAEAYVMRMKF